MFGPLCSSPGSAMEPLFQISLAEWSLHRALEAGEVAHLDFPRIARDDYDIGAVELVNTFFKERVANQSYLNDFKRRADDAGVKTLLIMCDHEGDLGDPKASRRDQAIDSHFAWVEVAAFLGCHSIRVNARSSGNPAEQ